MWAQLGMAGLQAMQDQKNKQNNLASNAITEKYSGYTGRHGDFSAQGKGSGWSTMLKGLGSGMMQDSLDAKDLADKQAEWKSDSDFYKQGGVGTPIASSSSPSSASPRATGGFAAMAQRGPAKTASANVPSMFQQNSTPLMLQGRQPSGNGFMDAIGVKPESAPGNIPFSPSANPWEAISKRPLMPTELQAPDAPMVDPTSASRNAIYNMIPDSSPIKGGGDSRLNLSMPDISMPEMPFKKQYSDAWNNAQNGPDKYFPKGWGDVRSGYGTGR